MVKPYKITVILVGPIQYMHKILSYFALQNENNSIVLLTWSSSQNI